MTDPFLQALMSLPEEDEFLDDEEMAAVEDSLRSIAAGEPCMTLEELMDGAFVWEQERAYLLGLYGDDLL
jgi:hypothetical protein